MTATRSAGPPVVRQISLPADARELGTLARIDYHDAFSAAVDGDRSPEQWVRAMLQEAPAAMRAQLVAGWTALGLVLDPPWAPRHVLGWSVEHSDRGHVLLTAGGRLGLSGQLLFRAQPDGLLFATLVQLTNPAARAAWAAVVGRHQRIVASLLRDAADRMRSR